MGNSIMDIITTKHLTQKIPSQRKGKELKTGHRRKYGGKGSK